jgi:hypothetical protein
MSPCDIPLLVLIFLIFSPSLLLINIIIAYSLLHFQTILNYNSSGSGEANQKFPFLHFPLRGGGVGGGAVQRKCKEIFGFARASPRARSRRTRSVRFGFKSPRAPRVRSEFAQRLIHHRRKKLPNPKGGKKPAPKAREWTKEPVASRRIGTGRAWRNARICLLFRI